MASIRNVFSFKHSLVDCLCSKAITNHNMALKNEPKSIFDSLISGFLASSGKIYAEQNLICTVHEHLRHGSRGSHKRVNDMSNKSPQNVIDSFFAEPNANSVTPKNSLRLFLLTGCKMSINTRATDTGRLRSRFQHRVFYE